jgi:hypothetical protein
MLHKTNIHVANQVGCVKINLTHDVQVKDPQILFRFKAKISFDLTKNFDLFRFCPELSFQVGDSGWS